MNISKKITSYAAFAVLAAGPVIAQPTLVGTFEGVTPEGQNSFLFEIISENLTGSYAAEIGFVAPGGVSNETWASEAFLPSDTFGVAQAANGGVGYAFEEDSYTFFTTANPGNNPFTGELTDGLDGFITTETTIFLAYGSTTNLGSPTPLARIVTLGNEISFSGIIAQQPANGGVAQNFQVSGVAAVPEPTTAALLGLGGLALMARKRRQA